MHGIEISAPQIEKFERWGFIRRDDGSWPIAKTAARIRRMHQAAAAEKRLLPYPRRLIYLRASNDDLLFEIDDVRIAEALVAMPEIARSYQKLQQVYAGYSRLGRSNSSSSRRRKLPRQSEWRSLLTSEFKRGVLENRVTGFFYWEKLLPIYGADLSGIPLEERIYLIAVVDTYLTTQLVTKFESQASENAPATVAAVRGLGTREESPHAVSRYSAPTRPRRRPRP